MRRRRQHARHRPGAGPERLSPPHRRHGPEGRNISAAARKERGRFTVAAAKRFPGPHLLPSEEAGLESVPDRPAEVRRVVCR